MSGFASARPARLPDAGFKLSVMRSWHTGQSRSSDDRGWSCDSGRLWQVRLNLKDRRVLWSIRHLVFTELRWSRKSHSKARKATPCHTTTPIISIDGKLRQVPRWSDRSLPVSWSAWHAGSQRASMRRKVSQLCRASSRASTWAMHGPCMCILRSLVSWDGESARPSSKTSQGWCVCTYLSHAWTDILPPWFARLILLSRCWSLEVVQRTLWHVLDVFSLLKAAVGIQDA